VARKGSARVLGKFPTSKLAVLAGSLASLGVITGALAMSRQSTAEDVPAAVEVAEAPAAPADPSQPAPQIIRRVYVIRRSSSADDGAAPAARPGLAAKAPRSAPAAMPPAQPASAPAPAQPTPQPVTKSRGS
jgi:hypothetical protein